MPTIVIDPVTRIEGHLAVRTELRDGKVSAGYMSGEMFRGFEVILKGRHPADAQQIVQRICGVCPVSHGVASVMAQEQAYGVAPPANGVLMRNLILGANYIQSHILHFYHLTALDYVDITAVTGYTGRDASLRALKGWVNGQIAAKSPYAGAPFLPRFEGNYIKSTELNLAATKHYVEALEMRTMAHRMAALFAGKIPHVPVLVPGGVTETVTADKIAAYGALLGKLREFIEETYLPDVMEVAKAFPEYLSLGKGCGNYLAFGGFSQSPDGGDRYLPSGTLIRGKPAPLDAGQIAEEVASSFFSSPTGLAPGKGETAPQPGKANAYTWIKAPRYGGQPMEVGPLARMLVAYHAGKSEVKSAVDGLLGKLGLKAEVLESVMGRHAARALECQLVAARCAHWLDALKPDAPTCNECRIPAVGEGVGLVEAPRGALGHWLAVKGGVIERYQCVVPTTWNCSPRDDRGVPGPVEQAVVDLPVADAKNPIEVVRVVRSFDPCIACAVH